MREGFRKFFPLFILAVLLWLSHSTSFGQGYDAGEALYAGAGSRIAQNGLNADLSAYFAWVANPIFTSVMLAAGYRMFGESPLVSRLTMFFLPAAFCLFLYLYLRRREGAFVAFVAVLLIIVNPVFMIYSRYVGSDAPFFALTSVSLVLLVYGGSSGGQVFSSLFLGLSLATKYLAVFLFPVPLVYSLIKAGIPRGLSRAKLLPAVRFNIWYFGLALAVSAPFLFFGFLQLGGIMSPNLVGVFAPDLRLLIPRFFAYLMWLGLFIGPLSLLVVVDLWKRVGKIRFALMVAGLAILTTVVHLFFPISSLHTYGGSVGEMNLLGLEIYFSGLETYLHFGLFLALLMAEIFVLNITLEIIRHKEKTIFVLFCWILVTIILMAFRMDAQRYLLAVLTPLSIYIALVAKRMYSSGMKPLAQWTLVVHAAVFLAIGAFLLGLASWAYSILRSFNWLQ